MNNKLLLSAILLTALFVRFVNLSSYPVGFSIDEISIGYNAYSILTTGADEWGEKFPLAFRSLSDYKPPVSVYLTSISMLIFGFNEFAIRFPNAFLGSLTALVFWAFVESLKAFGKKWALAGAAWIAINPWHIYYSRAAFECLVALFFVITGVWLFLRGTAKKSYLSLYLSIACFGVSVWTYHAERVFVPLLVGFLVYQKRKHVLPMFWREPLRLSIGALLILLFAVPFFYLLLFSPAIGTRAADTSLLRDFHLAGSLHNGHYANGLELIFDNDLFLVVRNFMGKYLNYFDIEYLFKNGLALTPKEYPGMGLFYLANLPVLALGAYGLFFSKKKELRNISLALFVLGPLPAALTLDEQHSLRALTWLPFWGLAFVSGIEMFGKLRLNFKKFAVVLYVIFLGINVVYFMDMYFRQFPYFYGEYWMYGFKQAALIGCEEKDRYDTVLITDTFGSEGPLYTGAPYEYVLFYCKIPPREFLANGRTIPGFVHRRPDWVNDSKKNMLLIAAPYDLPLEEITEERKEYINYPNGKTAFVVVRPESNNEN